LVPGEGEGSDLSRGKPLRRRYQRVKSDPEASKKKGRRSQ